MAESERSRMGAEGRRSNNEPAEVAAMLAVGVTTTEDGLDKELLSRYSASGRDLIGDKGELVARDEARGGTIMCEGRWPRLGRAATGGEGAAGGGEGVGAVTTGAGGTLGSSFSL